MEIKKTVLHDVHVALGAKMIPFAGYDMPVRYTSLMEEHMAVRESVGVFDVSHMGEFILEGAAALDLIQRVSSNDASTLAIGQAQYSCMPNDKGGIVDDLIIYRLEAEKYLLVVNASNIEKDWDWIQRENTMGVAMTDKSDDFVLLAVQGPNSTLLLQRLTDVDLGNIDYYHFTQGEIAGAKDVIISATGYTGSGGFELYIPSSDGEKVWQAIFDQKDADIPVLPAGLGARDTLRLEMGYCLYGNDIDDTTSPIQGGLSWITKFNHDFINKKNLESEKATGATKRLVGFVMQEKGIPRAGYDILSSDREIIGRVTSGTMSPMLEKGIGLGYVQIPHHKKGTDLFIQIRKKQIPAKVQRPPFVDIPKL